MTPFSICASADLHLGMRFSGYPFVKKELSKARYTALENLVSTANRISCDLLVIAGDLFDRPNLPDGEIQTTLETLSRFQGRLILLLPGNHDFLLGAGAPLWKRIDDERLDRLIVLKETRPLSLDAYGLPVTVYPGPCTAPHSNENRIGWVREARNAGGNEGLFHLGIAHGSIAGLSPDLNDEYYPMTPRELESAGLDLWIIGHTHVSHPEAAAAGTLLVPGTPEPDGFDRQGDGTAWIVRVDESKTPAFEKISTGSYRFDRREQRIESADDLPKLAEELKQTADPSLLFQLTLSGTLDKTDFPKLAEIQPDLESLFFYLAVDTDAVEPAVTTQVIEDEFIQGSFPRELLTRLQKEEDGAAVRKAYEIIQELRK